MKTFQPAALKTLVQLFNEEARLVGQQRAITVTLGSMLLQPEFQLA